MRTPLTDTDRTEPKGPSETASYIEALVGELARIAAADRMPMLHYLLEMAREEAASIARRTAPSNADTSLNTELR